MPVVHIEPLRDVPGGTSSAQITVTAQAFRNGKPAIRLSTDDVNFSPKIETVLKAPGSINLFYLPAGVYWRVSFRTREEYYVTNVVLPGGGGPFDFNQLTVIDPTTSLPDPGTSQADAFLDALENIRDQIIDAQGVTVIGGHLASGHLILEFVDGSTADLGSVIGPQGAAGTSGAQGPQGVPGIQGIKGDTGAQGVPGPTGAQGIQGVKGDTGDTGPRGEDGTSFTPLGSKNSPGELPIPGVPGSAYLVAGHFYFWNQSTMQWIDAGSIQGPQGAKGDQGDIGPQGATGATGAQGVKGDTGSQGIQGQTGAQGATGAVGPKGDTGLQGLPGATGAKGDQGIQGAKGDTGSQGPKGDTGDQGIQGVQGPKGDTGSQGIQGPAGNNGADGVPDQFFLSTTQPTASGPYVWFEIDGSGNLIDIYTGSN